jgi:predicted kinase
MQYQNLSLILLRGLPGSGKSTLANLLSEGGKYPVFSIDEFFSHAVTGEYIFDHTKNHLAYKQCEERTQKAMGEKQEKIFVDNTFTIDWEILPYFKLAATYGYRVFVVTVENHHGASNIHGVSEEQLKKMAAKYQVKLM